MVSSSHTIPIQYWFWWYNLCFSFGGMNPSWITSTQPLYTNQVDIRDPNVPIIYSESKGYIKYTSSNHSPASPIISQSIHPWIHSFINIYAIPYLPTISNLSFCFLGESTTLCRLFRDWEPRGLAYFYSSSETKKVKLWKHMRPTLHLAFPAKTAQNALQQ